MDSSYLNVKRMCVDATKRDPHISISTAESCPTGIWIAWLVMSGYGSKVESERIRMSLWNVDISNEWTHSRPRRAYPSSGIANKRSWLGSIPPKMTAGRSSDQVRSSNLRYFDLGWNLCVLSLNCGSSPSLVITSPKMKVPRL